MTNTNYRAAWGRVQDIKNDLQALINQRKYADEGARAKFDSLIAQTRADLKVAREQLEKLRG